MTNWVALPVLLPLAGGALSVALWWSRAAQRLIAVAATGAVLAISIYLLALVSSDGLQVVHMGEWLAPFGIVLVADLLSATMLLLAAITAFAVAVYSLATIGAEHERFGYYALLQLLLAGCNGAFLTGDIFNLYVWVEVLLVASFALLTLGGERAQMEGAIKYVALNLLSSMLLLAAVGLTYGLLGTLNMADLAEKFGQMEDTGVVTIVAILFLVAFSIKAAAFPFFFWLPASYHTPPVAVTALFAGLLTKVAVYALFRVFTLMFDHDPDYTHHLLLWIGGITMVTGVLGAAAQFEMRRLLAFHIISQIGYMIAGLALLTPLALAGGLFYVVHNIIAKSNLFLVSGAVYRLRGTYDLKQLGGLYRSHPGLSLIFLASALALAGVPPLAGFVAKLTLVRAGVEIAAWPILAAALFTSLLTLYSMMKIWLEAFWKPQPAGAPVPAAVSGPLWPLYAPMIALAALSVLFGVWGEPVFALVHAAAEQILDSSIYIEAVLGARP